MVGRHVGIGFTRLGSGELKEMDRIVILFCFSHNLFAVKWVDFREDNMLLFIGEIELDDERMGDTAEGGDKVHLPIRVLIRN